MLKITYRPLTKTEIKSVRRKNISHLVSNVEMIIGLFIFFTLIFIIPLLIYDKYDPVSSRIQGITSIIILLTAAGLTTFVFLRFESIHSLNRKKDIRKISAEIWHIKTTRAVQREDPEDFGIGFYIDITEKSNQPKVLFLWGQYLDIQPNFPNTEFKIYRRSDTKQLLDIELFGDYFKPERVLPPFSDEVWKSGTYHEDSEIIAINMDEIV